MTGAAIPCVRGPYASAFASLCTSLYPIFPASRSGKIRTFACPATGLPGALDSPTAGTIAASSCSSPSSFSSGVDPLKDDIHLPGWDASYTQDEVRELIRAYGELGEEGLWANIEYFLKRVIPVAEECDVVMALHPDDPPYPIFGLPRVITCEKNIDRYLSIVDSPANSLCLCTGSLGSSPDNDIPAMVRKYSAMGRIGFMHIRNVKILPDTSFEESGHLTQKGSLDMNAIVKALVETGFEGYFRPDHGRMIWGESGKPGYGLFDRALGSAYINGLIEANGGVIEE